MATHVFVWMDIVVSESNVNLLPWEAIGQAVDAAAMATNSQANEVSGREAHSVNSVMGCCNNRSCLIYKQKMLKLCSRCGAAKEYMRSNQANSDITSALVILRMQRNIIHVSQSFHHFDSHTV